MATGSLIIMFVYFIALIGIPVCIGIYVYRDASLRGMNPVLWTLLAVLAPIFIGFIIYLFMRESHSNLTCPSCASTVTEQYAACPNCGAKLKATCPNCGLVTEENWKICPNCTVPLPDETATFNPLIRKKDTILNKIPALIALLLLLLLGTLTLLVPMALTVSSSSMSTIQMGIEEIREQNNLELNTWTKDCDKDPSKVYALHHQASHGDKKATYYLVYLPSAINGMSYNVEAVSGLFNKRIELQLYPHINSAADENQLVAISYYGDDFLGLQVFLEGKKIDCKITETENNPTQFEMIYDDEDMNADR